MSIEEDLLHPVVADWLQEQGVEWYHEVMISGKFAVDFMAMGNGVTWLIECKRRVSPSRDIKQLQLYFDLLGDPRARIMLAIPDAYISSTQSNQYKAAGVTIMKVHGDFSPYTYRQGNRRRSVLHTFPEHSGLLLRFPDDLITEVYERHIQGKVTGVALMKEYGLTAGDLHMIVRLRNYAAEKLQGANQ